MELKKSQWSTDTDSLRLAVPISKVDKANRLVSGFATLDNDDRQGDIVLAEASKNAFKRFAGNIREMHQPIAVGRLVDFKEDSFFHDGNFYNGIYATVYVSKGAQDTWEKVLDGTLTGFSIGGEIKDSSTEFVKDAGNNGKTIRFIKEYDLTELSLVDNPANQLASIFSIQKSDTGSAITGMIADTGVVNVFWCETDRVAKSSLDTSENCNLCKSKMRNIDWFEKGENEAQKVEESVNKFLRQGEESDHSNGEGGVTKMATDEVRNEDRTAEQRAAGDDAAAATDEVGTQQNPQETTPPADERAESDATDEVAVTEPDFEKMFDGLKSSVNEALEKNQDAVQTAITEVESKVNEVTKALEDKTSEFQKSLDELSERLGSVKEEREGVEKRLDALESATAIKKSGEDEGPKPETTVKKGLWAGTILG